MNSRRLRLGFLMTALLLLTGVVLAEEGMWTFDNPPLKQLQEKYGFTPTQEWLDNIRLACLRPGGASASFVSPNGLVLTNHHVGRGQVQRLSSPQKDYIKDGFLARTLDEELKCPGMEVSVLISMENVTAQVQKAAEGKASGKEAVAAQKAEINRIEKESQEKTGLRSNVITLYQGGEYWLYRYKRYTDIRLVFAPEVQSAFFGGDPDNFTYPRYDLDMTLFRVYEDGKPLKTEHYLKFSPTGAQDGELVFVAGHPGSTLRLNTVTQLEYARDYSYPQRFKSMERSLKLAREYSKRGPEQARQAAGMIFGLENSKKTSTGEYEGLKNGQILEKKRAEEKAFRDKINANPQWKAAYGSAWDDIAAAQKLALSRNKQNTYYRMPGSSLTRVALTLVQYAAEKAKPDEQRLEGFHETQLSSLPFRLLSPAPVYPEMEEVLLADGLAQAVEELGTNDPFVKNVLEGKTPEALAKEAISGTKLADVNVRKALMDGGLEAVTKSDDPLIALARKVDPFVREMTKWYQDNVESVMRPAGEKIGKARFAVYGKTVNPDANGNLRLSYGVVKGYPMNGTIAQPITTFYGLYERAYSFGLKPPFNLPQRFLDGKDKLDLATPLNFACTCDIIGGNSGSPVINRAGELVGLVFDGNIESLVGRFVFDETANRTVSVHSAGMIEALRKLYGAEALVKELLGQ